MDRPDHPTSIVTLKDILDEIELFLGEDGAIYAQIERDGELATYMTSSSDFMTWLQGKAVEHLNTIPGAKLMEQAIKETEYTIRLSDFTWPVATRIHPAEHTVSIHLGDGEVLEIDESGAKVNKDSSVIFPTQPTAEKLPHPESADVLDVLPAILGLSENQCLLVVIWLMAQFQPEGRYPILIIIGPPQSGKTLLATKIRRLLDPRTLSFLSLSMSRDELNAAVSDNAILAFDNVENLPDWLAKNLLGLAEGTPIAVPGFTQPVRHKVPTILVCKELPDSPRLVENAIIVRLKERNAADFKAKKTLDNMFEQQWAKAFGSLVELCSQVLSLQDTVELTAVQRDAELERWILAVDKSLNLEGKLMDALTGSLEQALADIVNERPALRAFLTLVKSKGRVTATATKLLDDLESFLDDPKDARYPTSGKALTKLLRDHQRYIADIEIEFGVRTGKARDRNIVATWKSRKAGNGSPAIAPSSVTTTIKPKKGGGQAPDQLPLL